MEENLTPMSMENNRVVHQNRKTREMTWYSTSRTLVFNVTALVTTNIMIPNNC